MNTFSASPPTRAQLRSFGLTVGVALLVLGAIALWRHPARHLHPYLWTIGAALVVLGAIVPQSLRVPYRIWMTFGNALGTVVTGVILTVTFAVAFTLVGLVMRIVRRDALGLRWKPGAQPSYWQDREVVQIPNRHLRPF